MRWKKVLVHLMAVCLMAFPLMGCDDEGDSNVTIEEGSGGSGGGSAVLSSLSLAGSGSVDVGDSAQLTVTVSDQDGNTMENVNVSFSLTNNASGANLTPTSDVTGSNGQAQVTYTAGSTSGTVDTVQAEAGSITDSLQISVGASGPSSPQALLTGGAQTIPGAAFFERTDYVGAFDPNASETWAEGWTIRHGETSADAESRMGVAQNLDTSAFGPSTVGGLPVTDNGDGSVTISAGTMTEDATLTSDRVWQLAGPVFVGDKNNLPAAGEGITLTIEAGTKIEGLTDTGGIIPYLAVSRGHKIMAEGSQDAPILMTSDTAQDSGEWGGLIITGQAPINRTGGTGLGEGDTGTYGGDDPADNSGKLQYVVVAHAGNKFSDQNELNGIAFQAVGSGTTIDHIQVHRNLDDGVEFFGGTADAKHIFLTENEDDSLDWTDGWQGRVQFVSIHKNENSGDRGIEADNLEEDNNATPRSHPVLANLTIRGYPANSTGILLRRGTAANFYNAIVTGFGTAQIDLDNLATFNNAVEPQWPTLSGHLTMESSLVYGNGNPLFEDDETGDPWKVSDWYNNQDNISPQDPELNADGTLSAQSAAALKTAGASEFVREEEASPFFETTAYVGAFDPNASETWAEGWTIRHGETSADAESRMGVAQNLDTSAFGPSTVGGLPVTDNGDGSVTISAGTMTEDATLTSDRVWQLAGPVFVGDKNNLPAAGEGITLTIEAGTKIEGLTDTGGIIPYLAVSRGHKIMAEGSQDAPILMTSDTAQDSGEWGGLIITGQAPINRTGGTGLGEGDTGTYGGDDPADNSGKLQYVVVAHAGNKFSDQNELNGIAFQAVGSGTTIDHIQVHRNLDDGVEFFGGTADAKHIFLTENEDDSLDWTDGWQGRVQFVSIHKNENSGDRGIEADNLEEDNNATPRSHPVLANLTIRGYPANSTGILLRRGTAANFYNAIVTGFGTAQIDLDNLATFTNAGSSATSLSGQLTMESSLVYGNGNPLFEDFETEDPWKVSDWYNNQDNISPQDPMLNADGSLTN